MAHNAVKINGTGVIGSMNGNGQTPTFNTSALMTHGQNLNPDDQKVVFILGKNSASHFVFRSVVETIAELGIHCDVYITDNLPKSQNLKDKLALPENRNFAFFEHLIPDVVDPVLESFDQRGGLQLNNNGELRADLQYTPRQISEYYSSQNVNIVVTDMSDQSLPKQDRDINDPSFVQKILADKDKIARSYNIRGMQIMHQPLIDAFESGQMNGHKTRIINAHPGDVFSFPGTNIAFWAREKGYLQNVWTLHAIDRGIDTGDFLRKTMQALKNGKSLMQDMLSMTQKVSSMIVDDITTVFTGSEPTLTPQSQDPRFAQKPKQNYTHATHQEWLDGFKNKGISVADAQSYIEALVMDYTGSLYGERSEMLHHELGKAVLQWQQDYLNIYQAEYGTHPPEYDPNNPQDYFIKVPPPYKPPANTNTPTTTTNP